MNARIKYFYPSELISFAYIVLSELYILAFSDKISNFPTLLLNRVLIGGSILAVIFIDTYARNKVFRLVRHLLPLSFIIYWYPETYYMNECLFSNLDHLFVAADQWLFGYQPAMEFSKHLPYPWFSELMSFGYFSYFLIIMFIGFYFYAVDKKTGEKVVFITLCSFFLYYVLFIILPVVGPQFYFPEPDNHVPDGFYIRKLLVFIQSSGEKPTGAFPSSHVGMSLIFLMLIFRYARHFFYYFIPVVIILIFSTVYIKAHYVIDVIGGFVSAFPIYYISRKCWRRLNH